MGSLRVGHDWATSFHFSLSCIGEGNGNPLQCSCLENPRDGGAWWAAVYGVAQGWPRLKRLSSSSSRWIKAFSLLKRFKSWPPYMCFLRSYCRTCFWRTRKQSQDKDREYRKWNCDWGAGERPPKSTARCQAPLAEVCGTEGSRDRKNRLLDKCLSGLLEHLDKLILST